MFVHSDFNLKFQNNFSQALSILYYYVLNVFKLMSAIFEFTQLHFIIFSIFLFCSYYIYIQSSFLNCRVSPNQYDALSGMRIGSRQSSVVDCLHPFPNWILPCTLDLDRFLFSALIFQTFFKHLLSKISDYWLVYLYSAAWFRQYVFSQFLEYRIIISLACDYRPFLWCVQSINELGFC